MEDFYRQFNFNGIFDLPDMSSIAGYEVGADGTWFAVDFAKCRKYRYYSYQSPWGVGDDFWQARKVIAISNLIEKELRFTGYRKASFVRVAILHLNGDGSSGLKQYADLILIYSSFILGIVYFAFLMAHSTCKRSPNS